MAARSSKQRSRPGWAKPPTWTPVAPLGELGAELDVLSEAVAQAVEAFRDGLARGAGQRSSSPPTPSAQNAEEYGSQGGRGAEVGHDGSRGEGRPLHQAVLITRSSTGSLHSVQVRKAQPHMTSDLVALTG